jgi:hypothetical protein
MKADLIAKIIRENLSIIVDTEQAPVIEGIEKAALRIHEVMTAFDKGNDLLQTALIKEQNY